GDNNQFHGLQAVPEISDLSRHKSDLLCHFRGYGNATAAAPNRFALLDPIELGADQPLNDVMHKTSTAGVFLFGGSF
ncbi:MAG: hypothetical protein QF437_07185, partial [Planctomycetota bacterium]|nr:hypothetical protein [Planctomycetota bacterium]